MATFKYSDFLYHKQSRVLSAEASTLGLSQIPSEISIQGKYDKLNFEGTKIVYDDEGDVLFWEYTCRGTMVRVNIFND